MDFTKEKNQYLSEIPKNVSSQESIELEDKYCAHTYAPLDVVIGKASGVFVWDMEGNRYYDFLSAYSAVSQGHNHPKIVETMKRQMDLVSLTSRAFYNDKLGQYGKFICSLLGYDKVCPMNAGAEAVETALKVARRWGYEKKNIPSNEAIIVSCNQNFHGRTIGVISLSSTELYKENFGPFLPNTMRVDFNDLEALRKVFEEHGDKICCFIVEPIQGEAGIFVPDDDYFKGVRELCDKHKVLLIADEIQTGLGRTGKMLCMEHFGVRPDIVCLGKALSGGMYPVSAVLADDEIMNCFKPSTHGSTFGGNPLGCAIAISSLKVIMDEKLAENAKKLGHVFRERMNAMVIEGGLIREVRGKGLLNAIEIDLKHPKMEEKGLNAYQICRMMKKKGMLAKQTHSNKIRFAPPLVISEEQMEECIRIVETTIKEVLK